MNYCSDVIVSQDILYLQLSMWRCSDELRVMVDHLHRSSKKDMTKHYIGEDGMLIFFFKNISYIRGSYTCLSHLLIIFGQASCQSVISLVLWNLLCFYMKLFFPV
jgi:hypothetical protein